MMKNVNEHIAPVGFVYRRPVSNILHAVLLEEFGGVVAEARQQFSQFSWRCMIDPQLIDAGCRLLGSARCEATKSAAESNGTEESDSSNVRLVTADILAKG